MTQLHASKKSRFGGDDDEELVRKVSENLITQETLSEKLAKHVEQVYSSSIWLFYCEQCSFLTIHKLKGYNRQET